MIGVLLFANALEAQSPPDSSSRRGLFGWSDLALLGGFIGAGVVLAPIDDDIARRLQRTELQSNVRLADAATALDNAVNPGVAILGLATYASGRAFRQRRVADVGLHGVEALLASRGVITVLKGVFGRRRPYLQPNDPRDFRLFGAFRGGPDYRSFPSAHTSSAFAMATVVVVEARRWSPATTKVVAPALYGFATSAGVARMYHDAHWATDVVAGATVGTFIGLLVVRWNHANPGNFADRILLGVGPGTSHVSIRF